MKEALKELSRRRFVLEVEISNIVRDKIAEFEQETGANVTGVEITASTNYFVRLKDEPVHKRYTASVKIDI